MNKIYALVWNPAQDCWNVVSENCSRRGKRSSKRRLAVVLSLLGLAALEPAYALPTGQNIVSGQGNISTNGQQMTINQQSDKLITQWDSFSVGGNESVTFHQPGSSSVALNRVVGVNGSDIQGKIDANGKVFLVNPNGVVFGKNSQVNVGGLVASTRDISNADFLAGKNRFVGQSQAEMRNDGTLTAAQAGSVALLGARVSNQGVIQAQVGSIALGAGDDITLNFDGNKLLNLQVDSAAVNALAQNGGLLKAEGGQVLMTAKAAGDMLQTVVNNQGTITATTLSNQAGRIVLDGSNSGVVNVAGTLDASAAAGNGGRIETKGARVAVQPAAQVTTLAANGKTGSWQIAAAEVNVAETGTIKGETLSATLANSNIELASTQGNVSVSAPVEWQSGNKLTLTSERAGVNINAPLKATGAGAGLALNHKTGHKLNNGAAVTLSGTGASFSVNGEDYKVVQNVAQLQDIDNDLNGRYVLGNGISETRRMKSIGDNADFSGVFDGLGNTIKGLSIYSTGPFTGLFATSSGSISNVKLDALSVSGNGAASGGSMVGALTGFNTGEIANVEATGIRVSGGVDLGGLVGLNLGTIANASASGKVIAGRYTQSVGGLVGNNSNENAQIINSRAAIDISGDMQNAQTETGVGGLVGKNQGKVINSRSQATINVSGSALNIGGLAGINASRGQIINSGASGAIIGKKDSHVGGLIGLNRGIVINADASSRVEGWGTRSAGGLIGWNEQGTLSNVKASGEVTDTTGTYIGGLVGRNTGGRVGNAEASNNVTGGANAYIGGLIGHNENGDLNNLKSTGTTRGGENSNIGGLIGYNRGKLSNASAIGDVYSGKGSIAGGLVGIQSGYAIANAKADGGVIGTGSASVGGLAGENQGGALSNVQARSAVSGGAYAGGLVGNNIGGTIANAQAEGTAVAGNNSRVGGLIGNNERGTVNNSSARVDVRGGDKSYAGGLVGHNSGALILTNAKGNVIGGAESYVGGLVGLHAMGAYGDINQASSTGNVTGGNKSYVGGLVGQNEALITNSSASGLLRGGNGTTLGGLAGMNFGKITRSLFSGNIKVSPTAEGLRVGSLAGANFGSLEGNRVSGDVEKLPAAGLNLRPGSIK